jgi:hypothetical protein
MSKAETKSAKHAQQRVWKTRKQDADSDERTRIWKSSPTRERKPDSGRVVIPEEIRKVQKTRLNIPEEEEIMEQRTQQKI